ncbi:hypothetical protein [Phormidium sp. CCY1219]|nr:hypothetical protein [Phormidium sp. CCY1219]
MHFTTKMGWILYQKKPSRVRGFFVFIPFERVGSDRIYFRSAIAAEAFFC